LNLDNIARRVIMPALSPCAVCKMQEDEHLPDGHSFRRDETLPLWHGWHAFRRGLATNLHTLGVADKDIQAILRHSTLALTMNIYVKSRNEAQTIALDSLSERMGQTDVIH
jgi:integrase